MGYIWIKSFTIISILLAAFTLYVSSYKTVKILKILDASPNIKTWQFLRVLILIFIIGYLISAIIISTEPTNPLQLLIGVIFLMGSGFVLLVVQAATNDIVFIKKSRISISRQNIQLEKMKENSEFTSNEFSKDMVCRGDLQLIFKSTDGSSACVTSNTSEKLIKRGWGHL